MHTGNSVDPTLERSSYGRTIVSGVDRRHPTVADLRRQKGCMPFRMLRYLSLDEIYAACRELATDAQADACPERPHFVRDHAAKLDKFNNGLCPA